MRKTSLQIMNGCKDLHGSIDVTGTASPYNTLGQIVGYTPYHAALVETIVTLQLSLIFLLFLLLDIELMQKKEWGSSLAINISR